MRLFLLTDRFRLLLLLALFPLCTVAQNEFLFREINARQGLADNSAQTIKCLVDGRMVISSIGYVNFFDGINFTSIQTPNARYALSNYRGNYHMYIDNRMRLWLKHRYDVACVDLKTENLVYNVDSIFNAEGCAGHIEDMFVTTDSVLWMMSEGTLCSSKSNHRFPVLHKYNLQDVETWKDRLFLFYENGMAMCYSLKTGKYLYSTYAYEEQKGQNLSSSSLILKTKDAIFQIRNGKGHAVLLRFYPENRQWKMLLNENYSLNNMVHREGVIYIPSAYGYWEYNLQRDTLIHHEEIRLMGGKHLLTDMNVMNFDNQGGMWIGTEKRGLLYGKPITSPFLRYAWKGGGKAESFAALMDEQGIKESYLNKRGVNDSIIDSRGWKWVATYKGLQLFKDPAKEQPDSLFTVKDGMLNNIIHSLVEDDFHNIWISSSYGIACVVVKDGRVKFINSYNELDNVPAETFLPGRVMKMDDGTILMQTTDHILAFNPKRFTMMESTKLRLKPILTAMMVNGSNVSSGYNENIDLYLPEALSRTKRISLKYNQNSVSLTFSSLNYFRPLQTFYKVRVKGYSAEWKDWKILSYFNAKDNVDNRGILKIPLLSLEPGTYTVEVQSSMFPYEWKEEPTVLTVVVNAPWWQKSGVQIGFLLVILTLLILNIVQYKRFYRKKLFCGNKEALIVKRLRSYLFNCSSMQGEVLARNSGGLQWNNLSEQVTLDERFVHAMIKLQPFVQESSTEMDIQKMLSVVGMKRNRFLKLVADNISQNPKLLVYAIQIEKAKTLLQDSSLKIEEIATACNFATPNYFIACFYHAVRKTPLAYRRDYLKNN